MSQQWQGDNPFCLVIQPDDGQPQLIDVDQKGWLKDFSHLLRAPGLWILARKQGSQPVLELRVAEGEQPYYTARNYTAFLPPVGTAGLNEIDMATVKEQASVKVYGIGKKRTDGQVDRMWVLPNGAICAGDDDGPIADQLAKRLLAAVLQERINGPDDRRDSGSPGEEADSEAARQAGRQGREGGGEEDPRDEGAGVSGRDSDGKARGQGQAHARRDRSHQPRDG